MSRALFVLTLALTACSVKKGDGIAANELRSVDDFDAVANATDLPVIIEVGPEQTLELSCDENLLPWMETSVTDGMLVVELRPDLVLEPSVPCQLAVTVPTLHWLESSGGGGFEVFGLVNELEYVRNTGPGNVMVTGIRSETLRAINRYRGGMELAGTATWADLTNLGKGGIDAEALSCEHAEVSNDGDGDISVTVTETISVEVTDDGDVIIYGDPDEVKTEDSGCGDVEVD